MHQYHTALLFNRDPLRLLIIKPNSIKQWTRKSPFPFLFIRRGCSSHSRLRHLARLLISLPTPSQSTRHFCVWGREIKVINPDCMQQPEDHFSLSCKSPDSCEILLLSLAVLLAQPALRHQDHQSAVSINRRETRAGTHLRNRLFIFSSQKLELKRFFWTLALHQRPDKQKWQLRINGWFAAKVNFKVTLYIHLTWFHLRRSINLSNVLLVKSLG